MVYLIAINNALLEKIKSNKTKSYLIRVSQVTSIGSTRDDGFVSNISLEVKTHKKYEDNWHNNSHNNGSYHGIVVVAVTWVITSHKWLLRFIIIWKKQSISKADIKNLKGELWVALQKVSPRIFEWPGSIFTVLTCVLWNPNCPIFWSFFDPPRLFDLDFGPLVKKVNLLPKLLQSV